MDRFQMARLIDHTLLAPEATDDDVAALCREAVDLGVAAVCVSPSRLPIPTDLIGAGVAVAAVVGFPSGAHQPSVVATEAALAVEQGAGELDLVMDLGAAAAGDWAAVEAGIAAVRAAAPEPVVLKVILESGLWDRARLVEACRAAEAAGADFVKTSTGFHPSGGATVEAVATMAETVDGRLGVKASGGIRDAATARAMVEAGATRIGASKSRAILDGW